MLAKIKEYLSLLALVILILWMSSSLPSDLKVWVQGAITIGAVIVVITFFIRRFGKFGWKGGLGALVAITIVGIVLVQSQQPHDAYSPTQAPDLSGLWVLVGILMALIVIGLFITSHFRAGAIALVLFIAGGLTAMYFVRDSPTLSLDLPDLSWLGGGILIALEFVVIAVLVIGIKSADSISDYVRAEIRTTREEMWECGWDVELIEIVLKEMRKTYSKTGKMPSWDTVVFDLWPNLRLEEEERSESSG